MINGHSVCLYSFLISSFAFEFELINIDLLCMTFRIQWHFMELLSISILWIQLNLNEKKVQLTESFDEISNTDELMPEIFLVIFHRLMGDFFHLFCLLIDWLGFARKRCIADKEHVLSNYVSHWNEMGFDRAQKTRWEKSWFFHLISIDNKTIEWLMSTKH